MEKRRWHAWDSNPGWHEFILCNESVFTLKTADKCCQRLLYTMCIFLTCKICETSQVFQPKTICKQYT